MGFKMFVLQILLIMILSFQAAKSEKNEEFAEGDLEVQSHDMTSHAENDDMTSPVEKDDNDEELSEEVQIFQDDLEDENDDDATDIPSERMNDPWWLSSRRRAPVIRRRRYLRRRTRPIPRPPLRRRRGVFPTKKPQVTPPTSRRRSITPTRKPSNVRCYPVNRRRRYDIYKKYCRRYGK